LGGWKIPFLERAKIIPLRRKMKRFPPYFGEKRPFFPGVVLKGGEAPKIHPRGILKNSGEILLSQVWGALLITSWGKKGVSPRENFFPGGEKKASGDSPPSEGVGRPHTTITMCFHHTSPTIFWGGGRRSSVPPSTRGVVRAPPILPRRVSG